MLKINTGSSFLHPVTGKMIHPGQSYQDVSQKPKEKKEAANKKAGAASSGKEKAVKPDDGQGNEADQPPAE